MISLGALDFSQALIKACIDGNIAVAKKMIQNGAVCTNNEALSCACSSGNIELVKLLIENGANSFSDSLKAISSRGNYQMMNFLIEKGANSFSESLFSCFYSKNQKSIELLINKKADLNYENKNGDNPLKLAIKVNYVPCVVTLLYHGVSIEEKNIDMKNISKPSLIDLIDDYFNGKFWSINRFQFFPKKFRKQVFSFFVCVKLFSKKKFLKIPKPLLILISQFLLEQEVEQNRLSLKRKRKDKKNN